MSSAHARRRRQQHQALNAKARAARRADGPMGAPSAQPGRPLDAPRLMPMRSAHDRFRHCIGKVPFRSLRAATRSAARARRRERADIRAYACEFCTAWHIGHAPTVDA